MLCSLLQSGTVYVPKANRNYALRCMTQQDILQISLLEHQLFLSAWSDEMFLQDLGKEYALSLVVLDDTAIIAYIVIYLILDELHIANVGVAPEYQRLGIGYALLLTVLTTARICGYALAHLEVRESNRAAIALYAKLGFDQVGRRKNYYEIEHEDALLMSSLLQVNSRLQP